MILGKYAQPHPPFSLTTTNLPSINCRLPQTPRTPSTAAAHYFDDTFSRGNLRRKSSIPGTPLKSPGGRLRRSSTSRSIGNPSENGVSRRGSNAISDRDGDGKTENGFGEEEEEEKKEREDADEHVEKYIGEQLERIRTDWSESVAVYEDEFEAQLD